MRISALARLRDIRAYIAQDNPASAARVVSRVRAGADLLVQFPLAGRSGDLAGTRELVVAHSPNIIVYRIEQTEVVIVEVIHGAQRGGE